MNCGFVILNYVYYQETIKLISTISRYDSVSHIVVVDNKSSNESFEQLSRFASDKISVIQTPSNDGYSSGNNYGIRYLLDNFHVDVVAISNPDVEFEESFVVRLLSDFEKYPQMSVVTGVQTGPDGQLAPHAFWPDYTVGQYFRYKAFGLRTVYHLKKKSPDYLYAKEKLSNHLELFEVGTVEGSLFMIRSEDLKSVGLFDEHVSFYHEEDIFSKKIHGIDRTICVDPAVKYIHYGAQTTEKVFTSSAKARHLFRSSIYYFNNYLSHNKILQLLNYLLCWTLRIENYLANKFKSLLRK